MKLKMTSVNAHRILNSKNHMTREGCSNTTSTFSKDSPKMVLSAESYCRIADLIRFATVDCVPSQVTPSSAPITILPVCFKL